MNVSATSSAAAAHRLSSALSAGWLARRWTIAIVMIVLLAGALRVAGALGELCLDEIWTLDLLAPVTSAEQILWDVSHDNNHILNSLYLYLVGPNASPVVQRGLSIVLGTATVAVAGIAMRNNGRPAAFAAMALFAICYPMVHYGSEARGYAGLVLFSLIALVLLRRELDRPDPVNRHGLGLAIGLGLLSHLDMAASAVALGMWATWIVWRRSGRPRETLSATFSIFAPALVWAVFVGDCLFVGALRHGFVRGGHFPFTAESFVDAYGGLIGWELGLAGGWPAWPCMLGAALVVATASYVWRHREDHAGSLYVSAVILVPSAMFAAMLPNTQFIRHFIFSGAILLLFLADAFGRAWRQGGVSRNAAIAALAAILIGNAGSLAKFFAYGRGHYAEAVAAMAEEGGRPVYTGTEEFRTRMLVDFFGKKLDRTPIYVGAEDRCRFRPSWLLVENPPRAPESELALSSAECTLHFARQDVFPAWGLSGSVWVLYGRVP